MGRTPEWVQEHPGSKKSAIVVVTICKQNLASAYDIHGKDGYYLRNRLQDMENNLKNKFTWIEYTSEDASM